jgi:hypothetical protein
MTLSETEYALQLETLGHQVHANGSVWWKTKYPLFCEPAFEFRCFEPGAARPRASKAVLGYAHRVPEAGRSNRVIEYMVLDGDDLRGFSMARLGQKKRNQARQGLKRCQVSKLQTLTPWLEDLRRINISQAERLLMDTTFDTPPSDYVKHAEAWRSRMTTAFALPGRDWWGAFADGKLVAYLVTLSVENTLCIETSKAHTEALKLRPNDALYCTVLENAAQDPDCRQIMNSPASRGSLDHFKEEFLFEKRPLYFYNSQPRLRRVLGSLARARKMLACRLRARCSRKIA